MPIQILPPILANQIAAGEVVERPASVIKELVENSLDAGANKIDVELEKGGCQLIRIRDNGSGIRGEELTLALTRHATSKVSTLDDLERIVSLGFRGEALASISSVSRLTLTSRTAEQTEAWQAYAEGRDMDVTVKPAAHPVGTTVEVLDLFFNTPARRRFLRSEKTEFTHIDELLRRLALSRFDVSITLKHNGKLLRQYRAAKTDTQQEQRVIQACGAEFMQSALKVDCEHQGLHLHGWLAPYPLTGIADVQYCYVNGRMMRDKLLNHAIRQAYSESTDVSFQPAYVLFLELDPHQVDVNVHPSKHEVRFHESRQVHDFIVRVAGQALQAAYSVSTQDEVFSGIQDLAPDYPVAPLRTRSSSGQHQYSAPSGGYSSPSGSQLRAYDTLLRTEQPAYPAPARNASESFVSDGSDWHFLRLFRQRYVLSAKHDVLVLSDLSAVQKVQLQQQCESSGSGGLIAQPLLLPQRLELKQPAEWFDEYAEWLKKLGIRLNPLKNQQVIIQSVPALLRDTDLATTIPLLLDLLATYSSVVSPQNWCAFISAWFRIPGMIPGCYSADTARQLWLWMQENIADWQTDPRFTQPIALSSIIEVFSCD